MSIIEVLVADDHPLFLSGVQSEIDRQMDMSVVGVASTGAEALYLAKSLEPDVLLLDMQLPDIDGVEVSKRLVGRCSNATHWYSHAC